MSLLPTIIPVSNPQLQASGCTAPCTSRGGGIPSSQLVPAAWLLHNRSRTIHSTPCNWRKCLYISIYSVPELKPNPQRNKQRTQSRILCVLHFVRQLQGLGNHPPLPPITRLFTSNIANSTPSQTPLHKKFHFSPKT